MYVRSHMFACAVYVCSWVRRTRMCSVLVYVCACVVCVLECLDASIRAFVHVLGRDALCVVCALVCMCLCVCMCVCGNGFRTLCELACVFVGVVWIHSAAAPAGITSACVNVYVYVYVYVCACVHVCVPSHSSARPSSRGHAWSVFDRCVESVAQCGTSCSLPGMQTHTQTNQSY